MSIKSHPSAFADFDGCAMAMSDVKVQQVGQGVCEDSIPLLQLFCKSRITPK